MLYKKFKKKPKTNKKHTKNNLKRDTGLRRKFFLSFISAFTVFALFAGSFFYFYMGDRKITFVNNGVSQKISAPNANERKADASFSMLIVVKSDKDSSAKEFLLYRLDEEKERTAILALPKKLRVVSNGAGVSLLSVYHDNGISMAAEVLSKNFSLNIDYTIEVGSTNFSKIFDKVGGLYTDVPKTFEYCESKDAVPINLTQGRNQYVTGDKIYALIGESGDSETDIKGNLALQEDIMKQFVTTKLTGVYIKNPQKYYGPIFNLISTHFSMYNLMKKSTVIAKLSDEQKVVVPQVTFETNSEGSGLYKFTDDSVISDYFR